MAETRRWGPGGGLHPRHLALKRSRLRCSSPIVRGASLDDHTINAGPHSWSLGTQIGFDRWNRLGVTPRGMPRCVGQMVINRKSLSYGTARAVVALLGFDVVMAIAGRTALAKLLQAMQLLAIRDHRRSACRPRKRWAFIRRLFRFRMRTRKACGTGEQNAGRLSSEP